MKEELFLADELWLEIMSFLPSWFIVKTLSSIKHLFRIIKQYSKLENIYVCALTDEQADNFTNSALIDRITSLQLDKSDKIIGTVSKMKQLTKLNIKNTLQVDDLKKISEMNQLNELDISYSIYGEDGYEIISGMDQLTSLKANVLSSNSKRLQLISKMTNLTSLHLVLNSISPKEGKLLIDNLKNLKILNVRNNLMDDSCLESIGELNQLTYLDIGNNRIKLKGIQLICELKQLTKLKVNGNSIRSGAEFIGNLKQLKELDISSCGIDSNEHVLKSIAFLDQLTILDLSRNNSLNLDGFKYISEMRQLTHLSLIDVYMDKNKIEYLSQLEKLTTLLIGGNHSIFKAHDIGIEIISSKMKQLTSLDISNRQVDISGIQLFTQELNNLIHLNVGFLELKGNGIEFIYNLKKLRKLEMANNGITDEGIELIYELDNLTHLNIENNEITSKGLQSISKLENLTTLEANRNKIGNQAENIFKIFKNLKFLKIDYNLIDHQIKNSIMTNYFNIDTFCGYSRIEKIKLSLF